MSQATILVPAVLSTVPGPPVPADMVQALAGELVRQIFAQQQQPSPSVAPAPAAVPVVADPRLQVPVGDILDAHRRLKDQEFAAGLIGKDQQVNVELNLRHAAQWFGKKLVGECRAEDMIFYVRDHPEWESIHTRRQKVNAVVAAFGWAANQGMITSNPYARIPKATFGPPRREETTEPPAVKEEIPERDARPKPYTMEEIPVSRSSPCPKIQLFLAPDEAVPEAEEAIPASRHRQRLPHYLPWAKALEMLAWCENEVTRRAGFRRQESAIRDEACVRLMLYLGLRSSELLDLEVKHIEMKERRVMVRDGKGGKDRAIAVHENLLPHLEKYIARSKTGLVIESKKPGRDARGKYTYGRFSHRSLSHRVKRAGVLSGMPMHIHPHLLRHCFATHFLEVGGNIRYLQKLLGHADLSTTAVYLDLNTKQFEVEIDRM